MDTTRQSHWWWFDSHNSPRCSPWLESTLSELNEKTKTMLKLIEEDADSFAQRAEMYYKKRPELISLVEDFYRTHRSLAERYDLLKADPSVRVKSPLRHSFSHFPSGVYGNMLASVKSFDSYTEEAYNSDESVQSEIDDPEQEDDAHVDDQDGGEKEKLFWGGATYDELMKLREELERLQEENEIQRNELKQKDKENEKLVIQLSGNINELKSLRAEVDMIKRDNGITLQEQKTNIMKLKNEIENLKEQSMNQKEQLKQEEEDIIKVTKKLEGAKDELLKLRAKTQTENRLLNNALAQKDEEKREVIRQLSSAIEMLREENQLLKKSILKDAPKKWNPSEFQIFKGVGLKDLFKFSPKCQASIIPL